MSAIIRKMKKDDKSEVLGMMRIFYASPAVHTSGSEEIFAADFEGCISDSPFIEGYVLEDCDNILGYSMIAKSFSTEFGKPCVWIEDLYIKPDYRGTGLGDKLMSFMTEQYCDCIFRLEVEEENKTAVKLYKKHGFVTLPYVEMKK